MTKALSSSAMALPKNVFFGYGGGRAEVPNRHISLSNRREEQLTSALDKVHEVFLKYASKSPRLVGLRNALAD